MAIERLLIANRGEIACRVIETARDMGIETIAVYSDADVDARHVAIADRALHVGAAEPSDSYLRGERIIMAALEADADAIHPGYGFLSENPEFVEAVEAAGLIFVGPSAKAIRAMGLKDKAKALMAEAGVPVVPGYLGEDQGTDRLLSEAQEIGFPVLIKAVAGGGGKGMRLVQAAEDFVEALESAKAEARTAFGNDDVLIEKFVSKPRHIEVQVFGDGTHALHLFERDCSLQRRHQKVIEEAPAPGMTDEVREAMCSAAVRAAEAVGYKGAGTVEFIVDASEGLRADRFWFMEMNTRLQVEHPVTEEITGVDLVAWQLQVAAGGPLPSSQDDLSMKGHSIEARLYAEDPEVGFLPATGVLEHLSFPESARIDTGVRQGDEITPFYDPMIAKLTVHGASRDEALQQMSRALSKTDIAGAKTNIEFLKNLVRHRGFVSGDIDTGIIDRDGAKFVHQPEMSPEAKALGVITYLGLSGSAMQGFTLWGPLRHHLDLDGSAIVVTPKASGAIVEIDGGCIDCVFGVSGWRFDGELTDLRAVRLAEGVHVFGAGGGFFAFGDPLSRGAAVELNDAIEAPMPGLVTAVHVTDGEAVTAGQVLAVLEAMKMEHKLMAPRDGTIEAVTVKVGDQVTAGAILVRMEDAK